MIVELDEKDPLLRSWNDFLVDAGIPGSIFQSTFWADYREKKYGDEPHYIVKLDERGEVLGALLCLESCYAKHATFHRLRGHPLLFEGLNRCLLSPLMQRVLPYLYWENGPVISPTVNEEGLYDSVFDQLLSKAVELGGEEGCYSIGFARPSLYHDNRRVFLEHGFDGRHMGTFLVPLDKPEEELWNGLRRRMKRNIRRCLDMRVEIDEVEEREELKDVYGIHVEMCSRSGITILPYSHFTSLWDHFNPLGMMKLFVARYKGSPIAVDGVLLYNGLITAYCWADSDLAREEKLYVNDMLNWHVINWGRDNGYRFYDLAGVEIHKIDEGQSKAENIYSYKEKWGGELVEFNDYKLAVPSVYEKKKDILAICSRLIGGGDPSLR